MKRRHFLDVSLVLVLRGLPVQSAPLSYLPELMRESGTATVDWDSLMRELDAEYA